MNKIFDAFNKVETKEILNHLNSDEFNDKWERLGERLNHEETEAIIKSKYIIII